MSISSKLNQLHAQARRNVWMWLFSVFCRFALAAGFVPAGIVKIVDERFASGLSANHPMGHYLEALHLTGYYYTFIGVAQIAAAIMLLIPRTVTLGAFLYFPIILNITILTYATRFDGSIFTAPLMTLANLYLLGWNYEKWKYILPFNQPENDAGTQENFADDFQMRKGGESVLSRFGVHALFTRFRTFFKRLLSDKFPALFFAGVFAAMIVFVLVVPRLYSIKPRNTFPQCTKQFNDTKRTKAGENFCNCIHNNGEPLNKCLKGYNDAPDDNAEQ